VYSERWKTVGRFNLLASSVGILAGSPGNGENEHLNRINNLVGCLKKVEYRADSVTLPLLQLAKQASPLMTSLGQVEWFCQDIGVSHPLPYRSGTSPYQPTNLGYYLMQQGGVISFSDPESFLVLPSWKSSSRGSIGAKIRTTEKNGLLMFNSGPGKDYFGLELLDGFVYVHVNLGRNPVKFRASSSGRPLSDGEWHKIELTLNANTGRITIDGDIQNFKSQDYSEELELSGSFYVGGLDYMDPNLDVPAGLWSASLRHGFVGCLKDLIINGADIDLVSYTHEQNSGSIRTSCHVMPQTCHDRPCLHGGQCSEGWNRYICDCSQTSFFGATCSRGTSTVQFDGSNQMTIDRRQEIAAEAQDITLRFRTTSINGLLLTARSQMSLDRLELSVDGGRVKIFVQIGHYDKTLIIGQVMMVA
jgi:leucine-rich repeat transmembrane neuronal protein 1/2